ncbi:MAG: hypothetical protein ACREO9_10490 [Lysobacterales bacterium]
MAAAAPSLVKKFRPGLSARGILAYYLCLGVVLAWQYDWLLRAIAMREGGWSALFPLVILVQAVSSVTSAFTTRGTLKVPEYYLVATLAGISLGSLLQYYPMADPLHLLWALAPAFGLITFVFWRWSDWPAPVVAVALAAAFLPSAYMKAQSTTRILALPEVTLTRPAVLRGMKVPAAQARSYETIAATLSLIFKHQPDIPSALIGNGALFLCFTNNHANPSPYYVTWLGLADNAANLKRWSYIQSVRPLMFLHKARWRAVDDFYRNARYVPLLYVSEEALEIAVPQELAEAMGVTTYGAASKNGTTTGTTKP